MDQHQPLPANPPAARPAAQSAKSKGDVEWRVRILICLILAILGGLLLWRQLPREIARWYRAAAEVAKERGNPDAAMESLDESLAWDPYQPSVYIRRGGWRLDRQDPAGALADGNTALQMAQDLQMVPHTLEALRLRAEAFQRLGKYREAIEDSQRYYEETRELAAARPDAQLTSAVAMALNNLAYCRARGNLDLQMALEEIEESLAMMQSVGGDIEAHEIYALLDTRGYIHYRLGDYREALADLDAAVSGGMQHYQAMRRQLLWQMQLVPDERVFLATDKQRRNEMAVIYHHRGLIYEAIGMRDDAERDLKLAEEWGYDPDKGVW